jgi:hypothetical protein
MAASENLTLGRGQVYFGKFKSGTKVVEGYRFLGNAPQLNLSVENERLDHFSSTSGLREKDESIIVQRMLTGALTVDDMNFDNIAMFFQGDRSTQTQTSATAVANTFTGVKKGMSYQLGESTINPSGVRKVTSVVVTRSSTPMVLNTDYTLDADLALVTVLNTGAIADGDSITVTFNVSATTRRRIISGETQIEGALKYVSFNPAGEKVDYLLPYVKVTPTGDLSLIGEEWQSLQFTIEALVLGAQALLYIDGRPA